MAAGLRAGHLHLEAGSELADLDVASDITLEIEAKSNADKGRSSVEISLSWRDEPRQPSPPPLKISSDTFPSESWAPSESEPQPTTFAP